MLDHSTRIAILKLKKKGLSIRRIARTLKISRGAVREVLKSRTPEVPQLERPEKAGPYLDLIMKLIADCKGNLVRVHEELVAEGCDISYPALTSFCRRNGIGKKPKIPAGHYHFGPGKEMQHDTSPHRVKIDGKMCRAQAASLVLCYSRMLFFQYSPTFNRFDCKVFLTEAVKYFGRCCRECMIDNTHVVVLKGTGANMVPVPEMAAFGENLGFEFLAHEKGDANRSARVERPFHYIENNFLPGRTFSDWNDLNRQAIEWCDKVNSTFKRHLRAIPRELLAAEWPHLVELPDWIPEVYLLHHRIVGVDGYVCVNTNLYSVPFPVGRQVEVRETKDRIDIYDGPRLLASHERVAEPRKKRITNPAHRPRRGEGRRTRECSEEKIILRIAPELAEYVSQLKLRCRGPAILALRRLLTMIRDYPRQPLAAALAEAGRYGLFDLERVERMVLRRIATDFFLLSDDFMGGSHD